MVALLTSAASAQQDPMPEDLAWRLLELGRVVDPAKTAELYASLQQKEPYPGVKVERDVKYGPADRNLLDVFVPDTASSARPVLIYVHGGGFTTGNKRSNFSTAFYDNIMLWAVKNGFVGVNMTYRLAPASPWPAVVCFVGDGGSLFSIHALWTAAKYGIPSIFVCFVNHEYRLLKDLWCNAMGTTTETTKFVGMDFDNPNLNMQDIAEGFGARTEKIESLQSIGDVLRRAQAHQGPSFLLIDREP